MHLCDQLCSTPAVHWEQTMSSIARIFDLLFKSNASRIPDIFQSRIKGEFEGWSGSTLFTLVNGQVWQQSSYSFTRCNAHSPPVVIYRSGIGYKMKVDGVDQAIWVRRLK